jgi:hypothetical protein
VVSLDSRIMLYFSCLLSQRRFEPSEVYVGVVVYQMGMGNEL